MSKVIVTESYLEDIADAIREKTGGSDIYTPAEMAAAIIELPTGGGNNYSTVAQQVMDFSHGEATSQYMPNLTWVSNVALKP